jgi:hypothetical protein
MKNNDESQIREKLLLAQKMAQMPLWEIDRHEDFKVQFRVDEKVSPAMFKADPLIPGCYLANTLTLKAMKPTLFVAGSDLYELQNPHECACGKTWDEQFWKLCPYCGRN